jgi:replicative DNA helicase
MGLTAAEVEEELAEQFDAEAIRKRIELQQAEAAEAAGRRLEARYAHIRPLGVAADSYVRQVQTDDRFLLGIPALDIMTRGHGRKELTFITGRPFSGKTQVVLNAMHNNSDKYAIIFTPDESAEMVLSKLIAIRYGISAKRLEEGVKQAEKEILRIVRDAAAHDFNKLLIIDAGLTLLAMGHALEEAEDYWQHCADVAVYDYLELLAGESSFNGVTQAAKGLKQWTWEAKVPMLCIHQAKKGDGGNRGAAIGIDDMRFGGEAEAIMGIGVYRKRDNPKLDPRERAGHDNSVTCVLFKNKRPPGMVGEIDLYMDPETGHVRTLTSVDRYRSGEPTHDASVILSARKDLQ